MRAPQSPRIVWPAPPATIKLPPPAGQLTSEQAQAVRQFVARVGGLANARRALDMLALLKRAA